MQLLEEKKTTYISISFCGTETLGCQNSEADRMLMAPCLFKHPDHYNSIELMSTKVK